MEKRYYLAYGSNLNVWQMKHRCPSARIIGTAEIKDYRLLFKGSLTGSYLTIEKHQGSVVPVGVWEVSAKDEQQLDIYEGYPAFYYKKELDIEIKGIRTGRVRNRKAFVYIMHEDRPFGLPSSCYVKTCRQGYTDFQFDKMVLEQALADTKEGMNNEIRLYKRKSMS